ncbi:MAG TPA: LCP family protein [Candidatus Faecimorpha stercoravium]|nr:LCP family protein [Candidatus Faecimorpha stercoravium]
MAAKGPKKKKNAALIAGIVVTAIVLIIVVVALLALGYIYLRLNNIQRIPEVQQSSVTETFEQDSIGEENSTVVVDPEDVTWPVTNPSDDDSGNTYDGEWVYSDPNIVNILLIGIDGREYSGRSDTMILCTLNRTEKTVSMTSFLRDLYVQIPGYSDNRLNAAYAFGGTDLLDATLELNFGIHVDGHVMVDFNTFPQVIDALGGVDITLTQAESDYLGLSGAGEYHMDGELAMRYSRIRYIDSDFGRTNRQRTVLNSLFMRFKDLGWGEILGAANQVLDLVYTDMDAGTILSYGSEMLGIQEIQQYHVPDDGEYYDAVINGMMVLVPYLDDIHTRLGEVLYGIE